MPIKHIFHSNIADGTDTSLVRPSNWNDVHSITLTQSELSGIFDSAVGSITGMLYARGVSLWQAVNPGVSGYFLQSQNSIGVPQWVSISASGGGVSVAGTPLANQITGWANSLTILALSIGNNLSLVNATLSATGSGGGGGVSVIGAPAAGNLTRWTSGATITNTDLAGDVTTSGSTITAIKASVSLAGAPTTNTPAVGNNSTSIATTEFVTTAINNAIAGVNPAVAVQAATTQASDTSGLTYNNGVSGVGATFTGVANTALTVDGFTFTAVNQRILVKNDTQSPSGAFNGVYFVSQIQTALVPIILTRALDYDQPSDINNTGAIPVVNGTANGSTTWVLTSSVATIGTDPLTYAQFSLKPSTIPVISGTPSAGLLTGWGNGSSIIGVSIGPNISLTGGNTISAPNASGAVSIAGSPTSIFLTGWQNQITITSIGVGHGLTLGSGSLALVGGGVYPFVNFVPPTTVGFNWINQGTSSINVQNGVAVMQCLGTGGDAMRFYGTSVPAASFTAIAAFLPSPGFVQNFSIAAGYSEGLAITDGIRFKTFYFTHQTGLSLAQVLQMQYFSTASVFISTSNQYQFVPSPINWLRIQDNGTTRTYAYSVDPVNQGWTQLLSEAHASSVTPSQVGFITDIFQAALNGVSITGMPWVSWTLSSP